MKIWTMTRTSIYAGTGEVYLVTTAHKTYRGAVESAREELDYYRKYHTAGQTAHELLDAYAAGRRRARPDGDWFDAQDDECRLVISIDELTVG